MCNLEGDSLCAVPLSSYSMTQALEVSAYFTISLCRKFQIYLLKLSSILLGFTALTGQIIRVTPQRTQQNTPTKLTVKAKGGCKFHVTRNPGGGLYECLRCINISFPVCLPTSTHSCFKRDTTATASTAWIKNGVDILTNNCRIILSLAEACRAFFSTNIELQRFILKRNIESSQRRQTTGTELF